MPDPIRMIDDMHSRLCTQCIHDAEYRRDEGTGCNILLEAILIQGAPVEWVGGLCDEFEPEG